MRQFDYVLFDLDGTLLDTREGVLGAAVYTMNHYHKNIPEKDTLESLIGPPMQESFQRLYTLSDKEAMEMANVFREVYMMDEFLFNAVPYDGIYNLLDRLVKAEVKIGIATYKREDYAKRLLCKKGYNQYIHCIYGSDFEGELNKADIIRACLLNLECKDLSKAVYIGDGMSDGEGANEVGMNFIGVTYGFGFRTADDVVKYNPVAVVDSCGELKKILLG